jgi:hypothetical protein
MTDMANTPKEDKAPLRGNDKPGGGSQMPERQQGRKIPGDDNEDLDIEFRESKKD